MSAPPNILLLFSDEIRADALGCAGHPLVRTPHLDQLAARGVRFSRAYSTSPLCTPARAQVMTGLPCWRSEVWGLSDRFSPLIDTFAHRLTDAGYFTGVAGKMHLKPCSDGGNIREPRGFRHMQLSEEVPRLDDLDLDDYSLYLREHGYDVGKYTHGRRSPDHSLMGYRAQTSPLPEAHFDTTWTADRTIDMLERAATGTAPFCIWSSFVKPHFPCELPSDWPCPYDPADVLLDPSWDPAPTPDAEPFAVIREAQRTAASTGWLEERTLREFAAYYFANITLMDRHIGRVLAALERLGLAENTLVIFTADHGEHLGARSMLGKADFYEESAAIPFIAAGAGVAGAGRVDSSLITLEDLPATFTDLAGAPPLRGAVGQSLRPLLANASDTTWRSNIYSVLGGLFHFEQHNAQAAVTTDRWKYMYAFAGGHEKLFDLHADPHELKDLAGTTDGRTRCAELQRRLADWFAENGAAFLTVDHRLRRDLGD
jgi:arylsulfatase A-like enzyme